MTELFSKGHGDALPKKCIPGNKATVVDVSASQNHSPWGNSLDRPFQHWVVHGGNFTETVILVQDVMLLGGDFSGNFRAGGASVLVEVEPGAASHASTVGKSRVFIDDHGNVTKTTLAYHSSVFHPNPLNVWIFVFVMFAEVFRTCTTTLCLRYTPVCLSLPSHA